MSSNGNLPKGWQRKRLDEVTDIRFSSVDKNVVADEVPVRLCNYMEVWKNPYIHGGLNFMKGSATPAEVERFTVELNDVLLTKDSETKDEIAEPSLVREKIDGLVLGYHLALLRPDENQVHGPFLAAQLRTQEFRAQFVRAASGVTRYGLSLGAVGSAEVWLPPTTLQRRIADILWACHDAIEQTRVVIDQTRKLKTSLLQDLLTNGLPGRHKKFQPFRYLGRIPATWRVVTFNDLANIVRGSSPRPAGDPRYFNGDHIPWITVLEATCDDWVYLNSTTTYLTEEGKRNSRTLDSGTLILTNSGATLGVPKIMSMQACANDGIAAFLQLSDEAEKLFLYYYLLRMTSIFRDVIAPGLGQPNLNTDLIGTTPVPLPLRDEQAAIASALFSIDEQIRIERLHLAGLIELNSALSQALLTGRVPVSAKGNV